MDETVAATTQDGTPNVQTPDQETSVDGEEEMSQNSEDEEERAEKGNHEAFDSLKEDLTVQEAIEIVKQMGRSTSLDNEEFYKLYQSAHVLASTVSTIARISTGGSVSDPMVGVHPSVSGLSLVVRLCTHCADGRRYVPGGQSDATRLGISTAKYSENCMFPHILTRNNEGDDEFWCETQKQVVFRVDVREETTSALTSGIDLAGRLKAMGSKTDPLFVLNLRLNARTEAGGLKKPIGTGPNKTFSRPIMDSRGQSQLLVPSEVTNADHYIRTVESNGFVRFAFRFNSGLSSHSTLPRNLPFVLEVVSLHPCLKHLHAVSPPFFVANKFRKNGYGLDRGEVWMEGDNSQERLKVRGKKRTAVEEAPQT
jgi:hypothetical protein